jgi:hypothetical protein
MSWRRRRSAYYSRNDSYSRSANAEAAEAEGRLPRTRAAAALGVSVAAFDAGCAAAEYRSTEWHHVGKYATMVDYYDTTELEESVEFWQGAAAAYKSKVKQAELRARLPALLAKRKAERVKAFTAKLLRQRDCSVLVVSGRAASELRWAKLCQKAAADAGFDKYSINGLVPPGNFSRLTATLAAMHLERQEADRQRAAEQQRRQERDRLHARTNEIAAIVTTVQPVNDPRRVFLPANAVTIAEVAADGWQRSMAEAKVEALVRGFNGVAFHNLTKDKHGNGWVPVRYSLKEMIEA